MIPEYIPGDYVMVLYGQGLFAFRVVTFETWDSPMLVQRRCYDNSYECCFVDPKKTYLLYSLNMNYEDLIKDNHHGEG